MREFEMGDCGSWQGTEVGACENKNDQSSSTELGKIIK